MHFLYACACATSVISKFACNGEELQLVAAGEPRLRAFITAAATSKSNWMESPPQGSHPCTLVKVPKWEQTSPHGLPHGRGQAWGRLFIIHDISYLTVLTVLGLQVPGLSRAVHRSRLHNPLFSELLHNIQLDYRFLFQFIPIFPTAAVPRYLNPRVNSPFPYRFETRRI